jgi:hypothetical protein
MSAIFDIGAAGPGGATVTTAAVLPWLFEVVNQFARKPEGAMLELLLIVIGACGVAAGIIGKVVYRRRGVAAESSRDAESMGRMQLLSKPGQTEARQDGGDHS